MRLVLASASPWRRRILMNAGLAFDVIPADIDEGAIREALQGEGKNPSEIAAALAQEKSLSVSIQNPETLVIGADQILCHEGRIFEKAITKAGAAETLRALSGKTHRLISAVCVACNGDVLWSGTDHADLTMRSFDDRFLDTYLREVDEEILTGCVGAYAIEGIGLWLFEKIEGDHFTILGLPALPLLRFLSGLGVGL